MYNNAHVYLYTCRHTYECYSTLKKLASYALNYKSVCLAFFIVLTGEHQLLAGLVSLFTRLIKQENSYWEHRPFIIIISYGTIQLGLFM